MINMKNQLHFGKITISTETKRFLNRMIAKRQIVSKGYFCFRLETVEKI